MPRGGDTYYGEQFLGSKGDSNEESLEDMQRAMPCGSVSQVLTPHTPQLSMHINAFSKRLVIFSTQF